MGCAIVFGFLALEKKASFANKKRPICLFLNSKFCGLGCRRKKNSNQEASQVWSFQGSRFKSIWPLVNPKLKFSDQTIAEAPDACLKPGNLSLEFPEFELKVLWPNLVLIAQIRKDRKKQFFQWFPSFVGSPQEDLENTNLLLKL